MWLVGGTLGAAEISQRLRFGETLTRVLLLGSENTSEAARRHADLVIKPRVDGVGFLEFHQLDAARALIVAQSIRIVGDTPAEFAAFIKKDIAQWKAVATQANISISQ